MSSGVTGPIIDYRTKRLLMICAALIMSSTSIFLSVVLFVRSSNHTDRAIREYASEQVQLTRKIDEARSLGTCERANPVRAYLRLTSDPVFKNSVLAILNCPATIANQGHPVPLSSELQTEYVAAFKRGRILKIKDGKVQGFTTFDQYFGIIG